MLDIICRRFLEHRLITVEEETEESLVARAGAVQVSYLHEPASDLELLSIKKTGESGLRVFRDTSTKENEAAMEIAKGCLPDYLALLSRSRHPFAHVVRKSFEPYLDVPFPAETLFEKLFPDCRYIDLMAVLNIFYPKNRVGSP